MLAGAQSGKTTFGPWWVWREMQMRGGGDFLAVTSSYDLFKLKLLPTMRETFENVLKIGRFWSGAGIIEICNPEGRFLADRADGVMWGRIILRSAISRGGLESTTAAGAWIDEGGQDAFTSEVWEAVQRRLSLRQGRMLCTTTLYTGTGWLRNLYERWIAGEGTIDVIQFDSTENPSFTQEEFERVRATMQPWRFDLFYRGRFSIPPGQIYHLSAEKRVAPFRIPRHWRRHVGVDFGAINTALVWIAECPETGNYYVYRTSLSGNKTTQQHCEDILDFVERKSIDSFGIERTEKLENVVSWYGGSPSERQQRIDWHNNGVPVILPVINDVEAGIDRVTHLINTGKLHVFSDQDHFLYEMDHYSREMDDEGNVFEQIKNKASFHMMDALRYVAGDLVSGEVVNTEISVI